MKYGLKFILAGLLLIGAGTLIVNAFMESRRELLEEQERELLIKSASRVSVQYGESLVVLDTVAQLLGGIEVSEARDGLIPDSAIVHVQGKEWIYVKKDARTFVRKGISPTTFINAGELLVVTGAQLILSEEFRAQIASEE